MMNGFVGHRQTGSATRLSAAMLGLLLCLTSGTAAAQRDGAALPPDLDIEQFVREDASAPASAPAQEPELEWVRGRYENYAGGRSYRGGWWDTDYPDAGKNFLRGVQRYTNINAHSEHHRWIDLTDPELFENTFLYMTLKRIPIGTTNSGPDFSPEEVEALREFMFRGGFVLLDDFWGDAHWQDFEYEINKIFPDRELVELDTNHEIFHLFYDVETISQVPGRAVTWNGNQFNLDDPRYPPSVHAVLDDDGRVMLVANFNSDLGDGWEHTFEERYPTRYSNEAYKLGINYLIYAYTH